MERTPALQETHELDAPGASEPRYVTVQTVIDTPDYLDQVIQSARRELSGWSAKYRLYSDIARFQEQFGSVLAAIDASQPVGV